MERHICTVNCYHLNKAFSGSPKTTEIKYEMSWMNFFILPFVI